MILVTRPSPSGEQLLALLHQKALAAVHLPLINFSAGNGLSLLPKKLTMLESESIIIALSPRAVHFASDTLQKAQFHWRKDLTYLAIGQATAQVLQDACQKKVYHPNKLETSEELLAIPQLTTVKNKTILLLKGHGGRQLISQTLTAREARVINCECYQRNFIDYNGEILINHWQAQKITTIMATSGEILLRLHQLTPKHAHAWLFSRHIIVVSHRLAAIAKELGWQYVTLAKSASNQDLLRALF